MKFKFYNLAVLLLTLNFLYPNLVTAQNAGGIQTFDTFIPCGSGLTENFGLGSNGVFGSPLNGQTDYQYSTTGRGAGIYKIVTSVAYNKSGSSYILNDHTTGNGNGQMVVVNTGDEKSTIIHRRYTGLVKGKTYRFSSWLANTTDIADKPELTVQVTDYFSGGAIAHSANVEFAKQGDWSSHQLTFTATTTDVVVSIKNNSTNKSIKQIAIDDMSLVLDAPPTPVLSVTTTGCGAATIGQITVTSPLNPSSGPPTLEYSIDGGNVFQTSPVFNGIIATNDYDQMIIVRYIGSLDCSSFAFVGVRPVSCGPLPVSLREFKATKKGESAYLSWSTASEQNTKNFVIERTNDMLGQWESIGTVAAAGNSSVIKNYNFTDNNVLNGNNFYRLKILDIDGTFSKSETKLVVFSNANQLVKAYPNPVINLLEVSGIEAGSVLYLYDVTGKLVKTQKANGNKSQVAFNELMKGIYLLKVISANNVSTVIKVNKQ